MKEEVLPAEEDVVLVVGTYDGGILGYQVLLSSSRGAAAAAASSPEAAATSGAAATMGSRQLKQKQLQQMNGNDRVLPPTGGSHKRPAAAGAAAESAVEKDGKMHAYGALKLLFAVTSHVGSVKAIACNRKWLLTGSSDECIRIYRLTTRREDGLLNTGAAGSITALSFIDPFLISGDACGHLRVWSSNGWPLLCSFCTYQQPAARRRRQQQQQRSRVLPEGKKPLQQEKQQEAQEEQEEEEEEEDGGEQQSSEEEEEEEEQQQQGKRELYKQQQGKQRRVVGSSPGGGSAAAAPAVEPPSPLPPLRTEIVRCAPPPANAAAARRKAGAAAGRAGKEEKVGRASGDLQMAAAEDSGLQQEVPAGYGIRCIAVHPSGRACLVLCTSGELQLWNLMQGVCVVRQQLNANVEAVRWSLGGEMYALVYPSRVSLFKATDVAACMQVSAPSDLAAAAAARQRQQQQQQRKQHDAGPYNADWKQRHPLQRAGRRGGAAGAAAAQQQQNQETVAAAAASLFVQSGTWTSVCFVADGFLLLGDSRGRVWGLPATDLRHNASAVEAAAAAGAADERKTEKKRKREVAAAGRKETKKKEKQEEEDKEKEKDTAEEEEEERENSREAGRTADRSLVVGRRRCEASHVFLGQHKLRVKGIELVHLQQQMTVASSSSSSAFSSSSSDARSSSTAVTFVSADTNGSIHLWHFILRLLPPPESAAAVAWPVIVSPIATVEARCRVTCLATTFSPPGLPARAAASSVSEKMKRQQQERMKRQQQKQQPLQQGRKRAEGEDGQEVSMQQQQQQRLTTEHELQERRDTLSLQEQAKKKKKKQQKRQLGKKQKKQKQKHSLDQPLWPGRHVKREKQLQPPKRQQQTSAEGRHKTPPLLPRRDGHEEGAENRELFLVKKKNLIYKQKKLTNSK